MKLYVIKKMIYLESRKCYVTIVHNRFHYVKKTNFEIINLYQKQQYKAFLHGKLDNRYHFESIDYGFNRI